MRPRLPVVLLLLVGLTALTAIAHANPPDPLWIAGLWDGGDEDDAIVAATSSDATGPAVSIGLLGDLPLVGSPPADFPSARPCAARPAFASRAPPSA